jgi:GTP cyclohydrolase III
MFEGARDRKMVERREVLFHERDARADSVVQAIHVDDLRQHFVVRKMFARVQAFLHHERFDLGLQLWVGNLVAERRNGADEETLALRKQDRHRIEKRRANEVASAPIRDARRIHVEMNVARGNLGSGRVLGDHLNLGTDIYVR